MPGGKQRVGTFLNFFPPDKSLVSSLLERFFGGRKKRKKLVKHL